MSKIQISWSNMTKFKCNYVRDQNDKVNKCEEPKIPFLLYTLEPIYHKSNSKLLNLNIKFLSSLISVYPCTI